VIYQPSLPIQEGTSSNNEKSVTPTKQTDPKLMSIAEKTVYDAINKANKAADGRYTTCEFSVHEQTKRISVKVLDRDTHEVIREIPPEKVLDMVAKLWELAGIIVDEKR
jgi:flagellar protein FlaG